MPIKILMPALSPTMTEGNLAKWLKSEGDKVKAGEVIAEIETDKATMEVEAVDEGIIGKILVASGTEGVAVNSLIALLLEEGEDIISLEEYSKNTKTNDEDKLEISRTKEKESLLEESITLVKNNSSTIENNSSRIFASPLARRIAEQQKIDLTQLKGTGPHNRIIKIDVENYKPLAQKTSSSLNIRNNEEYKLVPNNNIRKIIAKRLLESKQTIPHFYLSIECKMDKLLNVRSELNNSNEIKISVNDFIILAAAKALEKVPEANASWEEAAIKYYNNVDISVAVAIEGGLITPVIRNADKKSLKSVSEEMKNLAKRARENKLKPEEFQGGNFSISNLGMYGIKKFSAIINPPQSCILAVGESSKRAIIDDGQIKIATIMDVTLSCDHRVVDGALGAGFLNMFKKFIENPLILLI